MTGERLRAAVYVDGYNLYYGIRDTGLKWLDLVALGRRLMPSADIERVVYCTARVTASDKDPSIATRQDTYLRALRTLDPAVEVIEGHFKIREVLGSRVPARGCSCCGMDLDEKCGCCAAERAKVRKPEEKGSDVNLAVSLVADAFRDRFDLALIVSNDSDLQLAVDVVRETGRQVYVCDPRSRQYPSLHGDARRTIRRAALESCQLPIEIRDHEDRVISKPDAW